MAGDVAGKVWALAEEVAARQGIELVEIEHSGGRRRQVIRLFIDKPDGVALGDCERLSRELAARLDEVDAVPTAYLLEVSSPGLDRPLRRPADFRRFAGRQVRLRLRGSRASEFPKGRVKGLLKGIEGERVIVETGDGTECSLELGEIAKANLEVDWEAEFRGRQSAGVEASRRGDEGGMQR